jgi:hypothetical protein
VEATGQLHVPAALMLEKGILPTFVCYSPLCSISKQRKVYNRLTQFILFRKHLEVLYARLQVSLITDLYQVLQLNITVVVTSLLNLSFLTAISQLHIEPV